MAHQQANSTGKTTVLTSANIKALLYGAMNVVSASGIVFANKAVFQTYDFHFTYALTWIHTVFTLVGMRVFASAGMFQTKAVPQPRLIPLAAAYVAYIVLCNLSLKVNTVGFYQVMKIAVAPTVIALEMVMFRRVPPVKIIASVMVVCLGIGVATVTDSQMVRNVVGILVGIGATIMTALYQIWAGSKQKELKSSSMQLLHAYTPQATLMLGVLVPLCEPMGWSSRAPGTLLAYRYTPVAAVAIVVSAVLGLLVSLSTFLVIGATSSLTYNVVGHLKTVIILSGGCLLFGDSMPVKKFVGVCIAMMGIVWYTQMKLMAPAGGSGVSASAAVAAAAASGGDGSSMQVLRAPLLPISSAPGGGKGDGLMPTPKSAWTATAATTSRRTGVPAQGHAATNGHGHTHAN